MKEWGESGSASDNHCSRFEHERTTPEIGVLDPRTRLFSL
jgi:hypothetical protein